MGAEQKVEVVSSVASDFIYFEVSCILQTAPERWLLSTCFSFLPAFFLLPCQSVEKNLSTEDRICFYSLCPHRGMINMKNVMGFVREKRILQKYNQYGHF